jgi:inhibitor of KinA sporulation pathway (predicted exonuclease)
MNRIFIDFEMNGTDPRLVSAKCLRQEIVEIGAVKMDQANRVIERFRCMVKPEFNGVIEKEIFRLTGIENADAWAAVELEQALAQFEAWCGTEDITIYAWSENDRAQLKRECAYKGIESRFLEEAQTTWVDFQKQFSEQLGEKHIMALCAAMQRMEIDVDGTLHDASWDAYNCAKLMQAVASPNFPQQRKQEEAYVLAVAPRAQGGLPPAVMTKLRALLAEPTPIAV